MPGSQGQVDFNDPRGHVTIKLFFFGETADKFGDLNAMRHTRTCKTSPKFPATRCSVQIFFFLLTQGIAGV